ncbi:hypothetical protein DFJ73DRAFT_552284 [Zopfochytrium polystomum]|nr:hypothetical protein DFJ73DRAFT_552284 [Zopfochytrium polystomum]
MNRTAAPETCYRNELIAHCIRLFALPPALTATSTLSSSSSSSSYYSISRLRIASRVSRSGVESQPPCSTAHQRHLCAARNTPQPNLGPSGHRGFLVIRKTNGSFESTQWIAPPPPSGPWTHVKRLELVSAAPAEPWLAARFWPILSRTRGSPGGSAINTLSLAGCTMDLAALRCCQNRFYNQASLSPRRVLRLERTAWNSRPSSNH